MTEKNRLRGKKARSAGQRFELKVRNDLESKGWVVSKWQNNVEFAVESKDSQEKGYVQSVVKVIGKLAKVKNKFRGPGIPMMLGAGFPDFIAFRYRTLSNVNSKEIPNILYEIIGVEVKSNGKLNKEEKQKCSWLLENNIFSKILIAKKGKKRGQIEYIEFKEKKEDV